MDDRTVVRLEVLKTLLQLEAVVGPEDLEDPDERDSRLWQRVDRLTAIVMGDRRLPLSGSEVITSVRGG